MPPSTVEVNDKIAPFPNLRRAGEELGVTLRSAGISQNVIVLGIVAAGVPVALEVAKTLEAAVDLILIRRLLTPHGPGSQLSAINVAGTLVVDEEVGPPPAKPETPLEYFLDDALNALKLRAQVCRGERLPTEITGKSVLIVDCGIRTGLTMQAAVGAVRTLNPARVTAAVPVTSVDGRQVIEALVDELIYLSAPDPFINAGRWFSDFSRLADDSISQALTAGR
jgi:predicted phosphoribosyltransferase